MRLHDTLASASIIVTCGPGGIGKTTSAAALGLALSERSDARILVLTVDPARRLADALGVSGIGNEPTPVGDKGTLSVAMLDPQASWDALIRRQAPDERTAERILGNVLYHNITRRFVQSHDYIAMERLFELVGREEYDLIILDTPPTRNALDFLDAPGRMADFFSSRFLKWLIAPSRSGVATVAAKPLTYVADKILGAAFLADITEFFLLLNSMYDGFVERARQVEALLQRETTKFMVVSSAERIPVSEASFFDSELRARDLHVAAWLVNRLSPAILSSDLDEELLGVGMAPDITTQGLAHSILGRALLEAHRIALDEAEVVAEITAGPTPVFPGYAVEGSLDNLAGVASFGHQLLDAEAF